MINKNGCRIFTPPLIVVLAIVIFLVNFNSAEKIGAQQVPYINQGNNTNMSDVTFFQLDDSILNLKSLVNITKSEIDNGNITGAQNLLDQIYNKLIEISSNSNNLIWDLSNQGN
jgi:hypothetical protein